MSYSALIVDDDVATRTVYALVLSPLGFRVLEAANVDQALTHLADHVPQLVLLDLRLPQRLGNDLLDYLYENPTFSDTRVIIITALIPKEMPLLRQNDAMMIKPVLPHQIRALVGDIISQ